MPVKVARGWDLEEDDMKQWSAQTGAGDSIIGAAEFLRQWHKVPDDKAVLVQDKIGGQYDVSWSISEDDRILQKEHRAKSEKAEKERLRKRRYRARKRDISDA
jgi:hypothetical protein